VRTALFFIALIGVILGLSVAYERRLSARAMAIRAIDAQHGTYGVKITGPAWFRSIVIYLGGDERMFYDPKRVSLGPGNKGYNPYRPLKDADIPELSACLQLFPNLEHLDLRYNGWLTDQGIASLPQLPKLKRIDLVGTAVSERGVSDLQHRYPGCAVTVKRRRE
jgi:hypothetical protein